jgi:putative FmdB family regulatory protein
MPIYVFRCPDCDHQVEQVRTISAMDDPGPICLQCYPLGDVRFADDCVPCAACEEPFCEDCGEHYADCGHPGPDSPLMERVESNDAKQGRLNEKE